MNLIEITEALQNARNGLSEENKRHEESAKKIKNDITILLEAEQLLLHDLNLERIQRAETVIRVSGELNSEIRQGAIDDFCNALTKSDYGLPYSNLHKYYVGVKNYDRFGDQRADCEYGFGPSHGYIVFRISLVDPKKDLTDSEKEDVLYYLKNLKRIQAAKKEIK